jgi:chemotaxis response regulator CheB
MANGNGNVAGQVSKDATDNAPVIVAIGASAGGVQALQAFSAEFLKTLARLSSWSCTLIPSTAASYRAL